MRRTPKISGNLSTAADDLKNNLHFAMLSAKNYYLRGEQAGSSAMGSNVSSGSNSVVNSEASYESAKSLMQQGPPPPVPRRRDSVLVSRWVYWEGENDYAQFIFFMGCWIYSENQAEFLIMVSRLRHIGGGIYSQLLVYSLNIVVT